MSIHRQPEEISAVLRVLRMNEKPPFDMAPIHPLIYQDFRTEFRNMEDIKEILIHPLQLFSENDYTTCELFSSCRSLAVTKMGKYVTLYGGAIPSYAPQITAFLRETAVNVCNFYAENHARGIPLLTFQKKYLKIMGMLGNADDALPLLDPPLEERVT